MAQKEKKGLGRLFGISVGILIAINAIPLICDYAFIIEGFKSYFVDFHLLDENGRGHSGFFGMGTVPLADGEIFEYAYETPDHAEVADNQRKVNRKKPDSNGFHWGNRGYVWSDYLKFLPARKTIVEGGRYGLEVLPTQMMEVTGPGAPWDVKGPHMSFLGKFPEYEIKFETEFFKFDLIYEARSVGWHLSNNGASFPAGDFGKGRMNELPCDVSGFITHKKSRSMHKVSGQGFMEDANGTWNWFEWGGHHWFSSHYSNGWAVSFWLSDEDWQWGSKKQPVELWVYDADRRQFYNSHDIEVISMDWDREPVNGMDFAQQYRIRALTNAGVVDLTAKSITFMPILGEIKFVPWDVKMAYSKGAMEGTFTYLDGSSVDLLDGVGTMENFQRFMPNMIYITPWSLILLVLIIGGRRVRNCGEDKNKAKRTLWWMAAWIIAVIGLTIVWM